RRTRDVSATRNDPPASNNLGSAVAPARARIYTTARGTGRPDESTTEPVTEGTERATKKKARNRRAERENTTRASFRRAHAPMDRTERARAARYPGSRIVTSSPAFPLPAGPKTCAAAVAAD